MSKKIDTSLKYIINNKQIVLDFLINMIIKYA
jgi:hypothetical protein